ncbi:unnamed protein product [Effrenium voratum]|nr:unnamed protein product [Effrenium voratum]CAJ1439719.1 unnamed protein product [Effrenium voratum]
MDGVVDADAGGVSSMNWGELLALLVTGGIFGAVWAILRPRGFAVQLCACGFVTSLVCTQLLMKHLASAARYRFPGLVTTLHFLFVWSVSWVFLAVRGEFQQCRPMSLGSGRRYAGFVLPIAASLPMSIVLNNTSLMYMGAGLAGVIGTLAPIITAILSHFLGRRISRAGWMGILVATCGASCIAMGEVEAGTQDEFVLLGLVLCSISVLLRAVKAVLQDKLLEPAAYDVEKGQAYAAPSLEPMHVWALTAPPCTLLALCYALCTESPAQAVTELTLSVGSLVLLSCISATVLNVLGMMTVKQLGASSMQIVGKLNTLVLLALSMGFWGEQMPKEVVLGTFFVLLGVAIFEHGYGNEFLRVHAGVPRAT